MPIIEGLEQHTPEWLQFRCGLVTSSRVEDAMKFLTRKSGDRVKGEETLARRDYRYNLAIETLTGIAMDSYVSPEMEWGIEYEPLARAAYEIIYDCEVQPIGFAVHDRISRFGASTDGLVGDEGVLEIKCPKTKTHLDYVLNGVVPEEYKPQMLAEMACTGRKWVDFVSFDPRLKSHNLKFFCRRFHRDEQAIAEMEAAVEKFLVEVDELLERLKQEDPSSLEGQLKQSLEAVSK